jgi:alpha-1,4-digalacturonate transport system permease protein
VDAATIGAYGCLVLGTAVMFLPVLWIVLSSFKGLNEIYRIPPTFLPEQWITSNYSGALERFPFLRYLTNSVVVTVVATAITLAINSMAAFALSKYRFPGRDAIFLVILGTLMIPLQVIMLPVYLVIAKLGMANSLLGIIIPPSATPTGVFLLRQYMLTIPDELIEAARMDGAGEFRIYWQVVLPLTRPALAVLTVFSIMWRWNDFLWPLIVINQDRLFTLQLGLARFRGELVTDWHYVLAMTVLSIIPITLVFAVLQRYLVSGIATTGLKG